VTADPRHIRIPLFVRVETPGASGLGPLYAYNISEGGVYLKAPGTAPEELAMGRGFTLRFALPDGGPKVSLLAEVVWVDPAPQALAGERALGVGARFTSVAPEVASRIAALVAAFRYQVLAFGLEDLTFIEAALGDLYRIVPTADLEQLLAAVRSGQAGLVLMNEATGQETTLQALEALLAAPTDRRPPVLYCAAAPSPALEALLDTHPLLQFATLPLARAELRSQARCAIDAFVASFQTELLADELARSLERLHRENAYLRERVDAPSRVEGMVGEGPAMQKAFQLIERVAPLSTTVMVLGETGTGKELVAQAVVARSERRDKPFIVLNCAAFTETLLENELFGHVRGAYTGADRERAGLFEAADGGTLFLDEIGELPTSMQPKLLRVLENGEVRRLGESRVRQVDVRIICATHRDLDQMVKDGTFRADLLYRLRTFVIALPPLRERQEDVPLLVEHFLARLCARHGRASAGLTAAASDLLRTQDWPGNARELANAVERLYVLAGPAVIDAPLVREVLGLSEEAPTPTRPLKVVLEEQERRLITAELERSGGVIAGAARALGMERTTLTRRMTQLGLRGTA
jgi:DNA-binding NtrC family response regulator/Tfp pilus assembly protein PilZ